MRAKVLLMAFLIGGGVTACGRAEAADLSPNNPVHCGVQFESYSQVAKLQDNRALERGFGARAQWYIEKAKRQGLDLSEEALLAVSDKIAAAKDGGLALATECTRRLEGDPEYRAHLEWLRIHRPD